MSTILVVGASRGIGLQLVRQTLEDGDQVHAVIRDPANADALKALHAEADGRLQLIGGDLTDPHLPHKLDDSLRDVQLDVVLLVAGIKPHRPEARDADAHEVQRLFVTNTTAPLAVAQVLSRRFNRGGVIGFLSSQMGSVALARSASMPLYGASKAALNSLIRSWEAQLGTLPFSLLALHPGWVRTDMGGDHAEVDVADSAAGLLREVRQRLGAPQCAFIDYLGQTLPW